MKRKRYSRNYLLTLSSRGARIKLDSNDYEEKIRELRVALNRIPKYMESHEFKKAIEDTQRVGAVLENMVVAISQSEAVKAFGRLAEQLSNIKLPQLSEEAKEGLGNYHYLNKLESLQWPLYFVFNKDLMQELAPYRSITEENKDEISTIVYEFCTAEFIDGLYMAWNNSSVMDKKRIPILQEAISLYNGRLYYGCVSILVCQLNGIITDIYNMQRQYGKDFDLEDVKMAYQSFNPQKEVPTRIKKDSERTQLLWFISDAEEGLMYWIKSIEYIYNIILTSEDSMNQSSHPCRNKICHGIQLNFGTREHALKSILTIDMMIRLGENLKHINENNVENQDA